MKIWWCDKHRSASHDGTFCHKTVAQALDRKYRSESDRLEPDPCRFGEMRLVSADALVIEKVEGEWPKWFVRLLQPGIRAALTTAAQVGEK